MTLTYLYAVVPAAATVPAVTGVDAEVPRLVVEDGLAAVVGSVAVDGFDEAGLSRGLEDLHRLEELARAHHGVVAACADDGPVAPVRLATVYRDDDGVRTLLRERAAEFTALLQRLDACREWGVKVWLAAAAAPHAEPAPTANGRPGTAYLMRRRAERDAGARHRERGAAVADRVHGALTGIAVAERRLAPQDAALSGRREEMVLNATYLVRRADEEAFARGVADAVAGEDGVEIVPTGPWPPFSFATVADR